MTSQHGTKPMCFWSMLARFAKPPQNVCDDNYSRQQRVFAAIPAAPLVLGSNTYAGSWCRFWPRLRQNICFVLCFVLIVFAVKQVYVVRLRNFDGECLNIPPLRICVFWCVKLLHWEMSMIHCRAQWLRGRASDSRLREPGFESCAAGLKPWARFFYSTLLQFTQLYKWVPGSRQWWICVRAAFAH